MGAAETFRSEHGRADNRTFAGVFGLLVITAVSIIPLTLTSIQLQESDALVIDMAGRQRMLLERYMKELLLESDGMDSAHAQTRELLRSRVTALIEGGPAATPLDHVAGTILPPAPTDEIRATLLDQRQRLDGFVLKADRFLRIPRRAAEYASGRDELLRDNAALLAVSNEAVTLLTRHSAARINSLIRWELLAVLIVIGIASVRTWHYRQSEAALKRSQAAAMEALRQRDAVKSSLLSSVSHELRTPLTSIKTMLFNLQDDPELSSAPARTECLTRIDDELDYLNRLVGNLLDMSRIEAGTLKPNREWHVLEELAEGAIRLIGPRLNGRILQVELSEELPPIWVDGVEIQQVLVNLLDNAVKFSPSDSPIVLKSSRQKDMVAVSVSNGGAGIPATELPRVFDRFYRVEREGPDRVPGTGLGLTICKAIVEAHGGMMTARSVPGTDTTIEFRLPMVTPGAGRAPEVS